jgi:hypothetical protein
MNAKFERNYGVLKLVYGCPKCKSTLISTRMEIEAGEDECPECRNVVHFPPSLLAKFDAAEHQHQETLAAKKEDKHQHKLQRKQRKRKVAWGPLVISLFIPVTLILLLIVGTWHQYTVVRPRQRAAAAEFSKWMNHEADTAERKRLWKMFGPETEADKTYVKIFFKKKKEEGWGNGMICKWQFDQFASWEESRKNRKPTARSTAKATDQEIKNYADRKFNELDAVPEYRIAVATDNFDLIDQFEKSKNQQIALHFGITPTQVTQARVRAVWNK